MSRRKKTSEEPIAPAGSGSTRRVPKLLIGTALIAVVVGGLCMAVWRHVAGHVMSGAQYQVLPEHIEIAAPPAWIRPDQGADLADGRIKSEALRDVQRNGPLSLLDPDLTVRIAGAFTAHPWVARVDRVSKRFPAGVMVSLAYRTPVAMVEVDDGAGVLPVDEHAVLLPTRDFTVEDAERYPRIAEIYTQPPPAVGNRWGDAAVLGGAQIAAAVSREWHNLKLAKIVPVERKPARSGFEYTYALITTSGTRVDWGRAPGTEVPGEVPAADKLAQLKRFHAQNGGTLDGPEGAWHIEIDEHGALLQKARPTVTPLPPPDENMPLDEPRLEEPVD